MPESVLPRDVSDGFAAFTLNRPGVMNALSFELRQALRQAFEELSLTGNFISAEQAERWGLLNRVVEPAALPGSCRALAHDVRSPASPSW